MKVYWRPAPSIWLVLTLVGAATSGLSLREGYRGIEAVRRVALARPHAEDIIRMARRNMISEWGRFVAQVLFGVAGILALFSKPRRYLTPPGPSDIVLPWILVGVEGILVGNSANEFFSSRRVLNRRASRTRSAAAQAKGGK